MSHLKSLFAEGWHEASCILRTHEYQVPHTKFSFLGNLASRICAPLFIRFPYDKPSSVFTMHVLSAYVWRSIIGINESACWSLLQAQIICVYMCMCMCVCVCLLDYFILQIQIVGHFLISVIGICRDGPMVTVMEECREESRSLYSINICKKGLLVIYMLGYHLLQSVKMLMPLRFNSILWPAEGYNINECLQGLQQGLLGRYCVTGFCRQEYIEAVVEDLGAVPVKSLHGCTVQKSCLTVYMEVSIRATVLIFLVKSYCAFQVIGRIMSRKEALSQFIQQIHGRPVVVKLNSGVDYRGKTDSLGY